MEDQLEDFFTQYFAEASRHSSREGGEKEETQSNQLPGLTSNLQPQTSILHQPASSLQPPDPPASILKLPTLNLSRSLVCSLSNPRPINYLLPPIEVFIRDTE